MRKKKRTTRTEVREKLKNEKGPKLTTLKKTSMLTFNVLQKSNLMLYEMERKRKIETHLKIEKYGMNMTRLKLRRQSL